MTAGIGPSTQRTGKAMLQLSSALAARSSWIAASCFVAASVLFVAQAKEEPRLSAQGTVTLGDIDLDGLSDELELVLGTQPDRQDSDGDGFGDLEEHARGSSPMNPLSQPSTGSFGLAFAAAQVDNTVSLVTTLFVDESKIGAVRLQLGVVYQGMLMRIEPRAFGPVTTQRVQAQDPRDRLTVLQFPLPLAMVRRVGQLNVVGILRDFSTNREEPAVGICPLVNFSGVTVTVQQTPAMRNYSGSRPAGIVYRPLVPDTDLPSTWDGGQVCFQRTAAIATNGASIVHEIEGADCMPMDTYCSSGDCGAGVGRSIELPDPGALAGG